MAGAWIWLRHHLGSDRVCPRYFRQNVTKFSVAAVTAGGCVRSAGSLGVLWRVDRDPRELTAYPRGLSQRRGRARAGNHKGRALSQDPSSPAIVSPAIPPAIASPTETTRSRPVVCPCCRLIADGSFLPTAALPGCLPLHARGAIGQPHYAPSGGCCIRWLCSDPIRPCSTCLDSGSFRFIRAQTGFDRDCLARLEM